MRLGNQIRAALDEPEKLIRIKNGLIFWSTMITGVHLTSSLHFRAECNVVNEFCCKIYNNHTMYGPPEVPGMVHPSNQIVLQLVVGDKIMCTKNSDVEVYCDAGKIVVRRAF